MKYYACSFCPINCNSDFLMSESEIKNKVFKYEANNYQSECYEYDINELKLVSEILFKRLWENNPSIDGYFVIPSSNADFGIYSVCNIWKCIFICWTEKFPKHTISDFIEFDSINLPTKEELTVEDKNKILDSTPNNNLTDIFNSIKWILYSKFPYKNIARFNDRLEEIWFLKYKNKKNTKSKEPTDKVLNIWYMYWSINKEKGYKSMKCTKKWKEFILNNLNSIINDKKFKI